MPCNALRASAGRAARNAAGLSPATAYQTYRSPFTKVSEGKYSCTLKLGLLLQALLTAGSYILCRGLHIILQNILPLSFAHYL